MLPVLYQFSFATAGEQMLLYLVALGITAYAAWVGWRSEPRRTNRFIKALTYGAIGALVGGVGLFFAIFKNTGIPIHTYGVLVGSGFVTAVTVSAWLAVREWPGELGLKRRDQIFDLAFYLFIGAMVGSRVLFIIVNWKDYAAQPSKIFSLGGGLVFYGGLIGASITSFVYARKTGIEFLRLADIAMPTVSLGQALGRLGCYASGCCWGDITGPGAKTAVHFPGTHALNLFGTDSSIPSLAYSSQVEDQRYVVEATGKVTHEAVDGAVKIATWVSQHGHTLPVHPTQLYESVGQLVLFVTLLLARNYRRFHGQIFGMWLMCYAVLRSSVELFRGDVERGTLNGLLNYLGLNTLAAKVPLEAWFNVSTSQFISMCMFALGAWTLVSRARALRQRPPLVVTADSEMTPSPT